MALSIKQLNGDSSFLLTFEPIVADDSPPSIFQEPFRILLDPWLCGPSSPEHHPSLSPSNHSKPMLLPSLHQLPVPDVVIISQHKNDHCHEATLRQLPGTGTKTVILAEPTAAKKIRSWGHFDHDKVITLSRWEDSRQTGRDSVARIEVPPHFPGGDVGEVTISFIPQKRDLRNQHPVVGITYRPPTPRSSRYNRPGMSPPTTPRSPISTLATPQLPPLRSPTTEATPTIRPIFPVLPTPPSSPSLRSKRSAASLTPHLRNRTVSVLYAPHGATYSSIESYATSHLVNEAALPLTALLHCFDDVDGPWWRPGAASLQSRGMSAGVETASALGARAWVSAHDGEKTATGFLKGRVLLRRRHGVNDVRREMEGSATGSPDQRPSKILTEVLALGIGDEVTLTSEGIWDVEPGMAPVESSRDSLDKHSMLRQYGMDDVLAGIASEPFSHQKSRASIASKIRLEPCKYVA
ncbi:hypothetical protein ACRE_087730 [Hapsidospora chrysogenum ATCC 11550]|uniref:N-acyl-phosphatidylethanolamine-hydrolyzing phospholipase D-like protein n=1 Tax=Hapsidospora chrysogenum (strain ATCC 11550 / CBS 779.69 / DSM 880 / IAM 14645 / JCM 23072 / IMI 49137) TaxID=857340 RepID=A0A086STV6_HAPC1|nr:hypothetical protein ACRE_087730 [Hapsidospora chrysogenum ATCC 11550]